MTEREESPPRPAAAGCPAERGRGSLPPSLTFLCAPARWPLPGGGRRDSERQPRAGSAARARSPAPGSSQGSSSAARPPPRSASAAIFARAPPRPPLPPPPPAAAAMEEAVPPPPPRCAFGVIADIQYADAEDGYDFGGCRRRYYRQSLAQLRAAVEAWAAERPPLAFVLQLGDSIDGLNARSGAAEGALERVLAALRRLPVPVHHAWGNHELYNFSRARLAHSGLRSRPAGPAAGPAGDCQAYHFSPAARLRVVVLDAYDLSTLGREPDSPRYQESLRLLREKNPNDNLNSPAGTPRLGLSAGSAGG